MRFILRNVALFVVGLAMIAMADPAQAATLTSTQISAIVSLLQSFGADQATINNVSAALGGSTTVSTNSCLSLTHNLYAGMTDSQSSGEVSKLQQFFGITPTGYFGPMTEEAAQNWQSSHGIVSSGSPDTTGYGFVGPKTRDALACGEAPPFALTQRTTPTQPTQPSNGTPTATINQSSLTSTSGTPTITGTYENASDIAVYVSPQPLPTTNPDFSKLIWAGDLGQGGGISGSGNRYSAPLIANGVWPAVSSGTLYVGVYNDSGGPTGSLLASGTLTITGISMATATIDQSLLTASSNTPTIQGNYSGTGGLEIVIVNGAASLPQNAVPSSPVFEDISDHGGSVLLTNGAFQDRVTPPLVNGTYTVGVYAETPDYTNEGFQGVTTSPGLLASATLTVNASTSIQSP